MGAVTRGDCERTSPLGDANVTEAVSNSPDRQGGDACIRDSRIPVCVLVNYHRLGGADADLLRDYPSLNESDLNTGSTRLTTTFHSAQPSPRGISLAL